MHIKGDFRSSARKKRAARKSTERNIYFTFLNLTYRLCYVNADKGFKTVHSHAVDGKRGNSAVSVIFFDDKPRKIVFIVGEHFGYGIIDYHGSKILSA